MFPHFPVPPPPPPHTHQIAGMWPPPPPIASHDPLEVPVDWFIDVPTASLSDVLRMSPAWDRQFGTRTSVQSGGDAQSRWTRLVVHGKPIPIHYLVAEVFKVSQCVEAGFAHDVAFPNDMVAYSDSEADVMPVYHGAWTEFCINKRFR